MYTSIATFGRNHLSTTCYGVLLHQSCKYLYHYINKSIHRLIFIIILILYYIQIGLVSNLCFVYNRLLVQIIFYAIDLAIQSNTAGYKFKMADIHVAVWVVAVVWPLLLIPLNELVKSREIK